MKVGSKMLRFLLVCSVFLSSNLPAVAQVPVRYTEGLLHGFLVLRTAEGEALAHGDLSQTARGNTVTSRLAFHFKDGSSREETAVFSQLRYFRLLRYQLREKGPAFEHPQQVSIDVSAGTVEVHSNDGNGKEKVTTEHMKLPPDLANGMLFILLKNLPPGSVETKASMLVTTPKPRLVGLAISAQGEDIFEISSEKRKATHYVVKVELKGITGLVAPLLGKEPPDIHAWILRGDAPAFVKSRGPLTAGGPIWQVELESPVWPHQADAK
ncbi:MAG TPA: hypothetical protein VII23_03090 [Terriglobales bacterium]|jgi:hypothetical protein